MATTQKNFSFRHFQWQHTQLLYGRIESCMRKKFRGKRMALLKVDGRRMMSDGQ